MANAVSSVDVPLSLFSGLVTELSPSDIPEGISPDNNDVVFTPGAVATRPGLNRVFALPISAIGPITYQKSFVTPSGVIKNLYFTSGEGKLWVEDVTNAPGVVTNLWTSPSASYASSVTCAGREYIALSDGLHGVDIPLSYDGTNLYRLTQDGPGASPTVTSVALPSVAMVASGAAPTTTIVNMTPAQLTYIGQPPYGVQHYFSMVIQVASTTGVTVGMTVTASGNSVSSYNTAWTVTSISGSAVICSAYLPSTATVGTGGTLTIGSNSTLTRVNNTVSCTAASAHNLQVGYLAQITGAGVSQIGGGISSIVLNNADNPGLATVTTASAHGLLPNNIVTITGVNGTTVATTGQVSSAVRSAQIVTVTTSVAHGLGVGSTVQVAGFTGADIPFNGQFVVLSVPSTTTFTYYQFDADATATTQGTATITYVWPLASVDPATNYFTVQTAPSATTFTIPLSYTDGTWTGGTISFSWDGKFYVTAVLSATSFQYQQYGPPATTSTVGTVTPYGQMAPGIHQCRVSFLLADGTITPPSPPTTFVANGGQYPSVTGILTGPSPAVVGRILQFTGAGGAYFFHIPTPAQVNGLTVSTATQINDNTTTSALLDFSDNTLYAATADSIPGNNLAAQVVLGPVAGVFTYASRLLTWGGWDKVQNLQGMGFDSGGQAADANTPSGWTKGNTAGGTLVNVRLGQGWQVTPDVSGAVYGLLQQTGYLDAYGAPIILGNTTYAVRFWAKTNGGIFTSNPKATFTITSVAGGFGFIAQVDISGAGPTGAWFTAVFNGTTPDNIPSDTIFDLGVYGIGDGTANATLDDITLYYSTQPYLDNEARISYAENYGAFDIKTGVLGSDDDLSPIRNFGVLRKTLFMVTGTGLHETRDNGQTEPSNWDVDEVADNCGAYSIASVARNPQGIGSAGKEWMVWSGPDGGQLFNGQQPVKITQEIQTIWDSIPAASAYRCWAKNYESSKRCYFGIPTANRSSMQVLVLDYRNLDGEEIASREPIHISFTGKMIASDLTRKWTVWSIPAYCGELMYRGTSAQPQIVFGCKTGVLGSGNAYILNPAQYHDDDFGQINWSYTTYFFVSHEMEQALQVGSHRKLYTMASAYIQGVGTWTITPLAASLTNAFPASGPWPYADNYDIDFGINVETTRCAFKITGQPTSGIDSYGKLQKLVINMAPAPWAKVRGSTGGSF